MRFSTGPVGVDGQNAQPSAAAAEMSAKESNVSADARSPRRAARRATPEPALSSWAARLGVDLSLLGEDMPDEVGAPVSSVVAAADAAPDRPSLESVLEKLLAFDGSIGVALVDSESGMVLGEAGSASNLGLSAAGASVILRARLATNKALGIAEKIDDVLISLTSQVQIIHPLANNPKFFVYMIGDKTKTGLAMARSKATEADLQIQF